ncbi:L-alanine-DL-glutamate epimerase [Tistlia consotensis]|uniref:L-alanine-DL-glutamate epimerase n=1 Tax=Tistlia consotensis USBA 355 TaxID=560819 RepID=A0A1Y6CKP7_9PROT|nr:enolase C-terminal domain-like protein [Tistlia consotensis]SMF72422.1 L-alanine-DL-glutamate epimerase [Tistlia consotensis USBA 355]SNS09101.1 L-alanine-DL-glutamate epimerase [Tistlia consotensis]
MTFSSAPIETVAVSAYRIPTDAPESDGTLAWDSTSLIVAEIAAGGRTGLGYSYGDPAAATLIRGTLAAVLEGRDALATGGCWRALVRAIRNDGRPGIASMAISALDNALWDLKARLLGLPLARLLGTVSESVEIYGSGGFTSYTDTQLSAQLAGWAEQGMTRVKMKVGRTPERDLARVETARRAVPAEVRLMVDANGGYDRKQALAFAERFAALGVDWFEEPVSSEDLEGLRLLRDRLPAPIEVTAGEYGYDSRYFRRMIEAGAVDVLQADATRCAGVTGFLAADALCRAFETPLSAHCAPALHCHLCCAALKARHIEWFHDHVRIEALLLDGAPRPDGGRVAFDAGRPGCGLELKRRDAERYAL